MSQPWWVRLLPTTVRTLPADLAAVAVLTVATALSATLPVVSETPVRIALGLVQSLFLVGYALVAALFPEAGDPAGDDGAPEGNSGTAGDDGAPEGNSGTAGDDDTVGGDDRSGIDGIERVALSFGLSIAVTPLLVLVLNLTPWGIRLLPILVAVGGFTLGSVAVAARRRRALPPDERFAVPYRAWLGAARAELFAPESRTDAALNVLLAASVLLAAATVTYAVAVPGQAETFSELYYLTENDDGELVADDYPTEFARGESRPLVIGVGNHEGETVDYSLVVELQEVRTTNNSTTVLEERELNRLRTRVGANETWETTYNVTPTMTGERLRLAFLLYVGDPPDDPTVDNAYREVHLWVNVSDP